MIVKRTDETRLHPDDTLQNAIDEGLEQVNRRTISLTLSSMAAGLILGFTAMPVGVIAAVMARFDSPLFSRVATALVYPLGFVICILSGAQLFTEHTATAVYAVLDHQASPLRLLRLWGLVIVGNLLGAAIIAGLLTLAEPVITAREGYVIIGRHLVAYGFWPLLVSAMLAGWLMAQGAWLVVGTASTIGQMLSVYAVTFVIGVGGLHHSIAGAVEMMLALLASREFTMASAAMFLGVSLIGNLIGGSTFVAVLNHAHIRTMQAVDQSPGAK